ncbi:site-specific integrase [Catalinimonas sp. 4WD22]|uniref:site-specific integrase n=1 Tax=Catalinimonas locisalis TaxID=3133978 RepID=UPI003101A43A
MKQHIKDFNELIAGASHFMTCELHYAPRTVGNYRRVWKLIRTYLAEHHITHYDQTVEAQLLHQWFGNRPMRSLSHHERISCHAARMLTEFQQNGQINLPTRPCKDPLIFEGPLGKVMTDFLEYQRNEKRLAKNTLDSYQRHLFSFLIYCHQHDIYSLPVIDLSVLLGYINQLNEQTTPIYMAICALRGFVRYAFAEKLIQVDYAKKIPRYKRVGQPQIPTTYTPEEIEKLITSVERGSTTGKRNYAIILLAARLGLRASDIARLQFDHLHWSSSSIHIKQYKTGQEVTLPLLADVGNAIIDYLKYARPSSSATQVFLTARPPYSPFLSSNIVTQVVQRAFGKAGISIQGKRFGSHALRHSLASRLLEVRTVLPVISEVLGHQSTESTRYYLRIDLASMQQCILEVPAVTPDFYEQKGGMFYE